MKVVYLIGPFRAETGWQIEQNIRRAEEVALEIWKMGAAVLCPHTNMRFFNGEASDGLWLAGDLELLSRADGAVLLPGWERSQGSLPELEAAATRGMRVFPWPAARAGLRGWIGASILTTDARQFAVRD